MAKKTPTPFDETNKVLDAVVASMRKLRLRMFAAYVRQQPLDPQVLTALRGFAALVNVASHNLPEPTASETMAYAYAEEEIAGMVDDSDDGALMEAVNGGLHDPSKDTGPDETEFVEAEFDRDCRAADYAAYLARGCKLDRKGEPM